MKIYVNPENKRIDKYICEKEDLTRVAIQRMITNGNILVNNKKVKPSYVLNKADTITIEAEEVVEADMKAEDIPLEIIYEDEDILVINKEKGMVVHPGNGNAYGTLANAVMGKCKESLSGIRRKNKTRNSS